MLLAGARALSSRLGSGSALGAGAGCSVGTAWMGDIASPSIDTWEMPGVLALLSTFAFRWMALGAKSNPVPITAIIATPDSNVIDGRFFTPAINDAMRLLDGLCDFVDLFIAP